MVSSEDAMNTTRALQNAGVAQPTSIRFRRLWRGRAAFVEIERLAPVSATECRANSAGSLIGITYDFKDMSSQIAMADFDHLILTARANIVVSEGAEVWTAYVLRCHSYWEESRT